MQMLQDWPSFVGPCDKTWLNSKHVKIMNFELVYGQKSCDVFADKIYLSILSCKIQSWVGEKLWLNILWNYLVVVQLQKTFDVLKHVVKPTETVNSVFDLEHLSVESVKTVEKSVKIVDFVFGQGNCAMWQW